MVFTSGTVKRKWMALDLPILNCATLRKIQLRLAALKKDKILNEDIFFLTEHFPIFTIGKNGQRKNLLISEKYLKDSGIEILRTERGGDITYHAPGQLIVYPVIDLKKNKLSIRGYVEKLEELMIRTSFDMGVKVTRVKNAIGVWTNSQKIGSLGIVVKKDITCYGIALNINLDLTPFTWINPCGLIGIRMTSIVQETKAKDINIAMAKRYMRKHIKDVFNITFQDYSNLDELYEDMKISDQMFED
ncbi:MAG: lipoyl(octanoyl) transferase LipB [Deltaproteobacteria bacterium]|nr:lipoyl(octanoyl) transferase LipB [Deltaproteobacteria bacterium]